MICYEYNGDGKRSKSHFTCIIADGNKTKTKRGVGKV